MIVVENLSVSYGQQQVLSAVNFTVETGGLVAILGANGAGKTSLLKSILHIHGDYQGRVLVDGENVATMKPKQRAHKMAYVPQSTGAHFLFSVFEVVLMGCVSKLPLGVSPSQTHRDLAHQALAELGISHLADKHLQQISGGERQLVFIARALVQNAGVFILDEPTASLDMANQVRVLEAIAALSKRGYTVLYTTHNPEHAYRYSQQILLLGKGSPAVLGAAKDVMNSQTMTQLYNTPMEVCSLYEDTVRVCVPMESENPSI